MMKTRLPATLFRLVLSCAEVRMMSQAVVILCLFLYPYLAKASLTEAAQPTEDTLTALAIPSDPIDPTPIVNSQKLFYGALSAQTGVSAMGAATWQIPIEVLPGVGGFQPQVGIGYDSQSGLGNVGWGCNVTGVSAITRGVKDIYHDGTAAGITYGSSDAYFLDGRRLILASGTEGAVGSLYHPEGDPFTDVMIKNGEYGTYFEMVSPDGGRAVYGAEINPRTRFTKGSTTITAAWHLRRLYNANGSVITYHYNDTDLYLCPSRINYYTNNSCCTVEFEYTTLGSAARKFRLMNVEGKQDKLLTQITCKEDGTLLRTYSFIYDTTSDGTAVKYPRLKKVECADNEGKNLLPLTLSWEGMPSFSQNRTTANVEIETSMIDANSSMFFSADLTGNGRSDIVRLSNVTEYSIRFENLKQSTTTNKLYIFRSQDNGSGQSDVPLTFDLGATLNWSDHSAVIGGTLPVDFDGDGRQDLFIPRHVVSDIFDQQYISYHAIFGSDVAAGNSTLLNLSCPLLSSTKDTPLFTISDFNKDGCSDIVYVERGSVSGSYPLHIIFGTSNRGAVDHSQLNLPLTQKPGRLFSSDYNNDGMADLLLVFDNSYTIFYNVLQPGGTTLFTTASMSSGSTISDTKGLFQGDFNGDGLVDFASNVGKSGDWYFHLNNGNGTFTKKLAATLDVMDQKTHNDDDKYGCQVLDFDHDGKSDIVFAKAMYSDKGSFRKTHILWLRSTGTSLVEVNRATTANRDDAYPQYFATGDFDGDGYEDLLNYGNNCYSGIDANAGQTLNIYLNNNLTASSGKVASVTDGLGNTTSFTYASLTQPSVYTRGSDATYPLADLQLPLHVVHTMTTPTGASDGSAATMTQTYRYEGLKAHLAGRGLLGFAKTTVTNDVMGTTTQSETGGWDTNDYFAPTTGKTTTWLGDTESSTPAVTETTLQVVNKDQQVRKNYFSYLSTITATDFDGNTTETTCTYDTEKGTLTGEKTTYDGDVGMYRQTTYDYGTSKHGNHWQPETVTTTQKHKDDTQPFTTVRAIAYNDTTGLPIHVTDHYGTPLALTTSYGYNTAGNVVSDTISGSGISQVIHHYEYDPTGRFVARETTTPAQLPCLRGAVQGTEGWETIITRTYDAWGHILTETDETDAAHPLTTTNSYDSFGNLTESVSPEGITTSVASQYVGDDDAVYFTLTTTAGSPWQMTYRDRLGRTAKTMSIGANQIPISSTTRYDSRGNTVMTATARGDLTTSQTRTYDDRRRLLTTTGSNGLTTTSSYSADGRTVTTTDNLGRTRKQTYDAWGLLKRSVEPIGSVTYRYSSTGQPKSVGTSEGGAVTMTYDSCGNQVTLTDSDAGLTTYSYNALGNIVSQTDARGITTTTTFDEHNRIKKTATSSADSMVVSYTYGTTGTATGRLTNMAKGNYGISYVYDPYGRIAQEVRNFGSRQYVFAHQYDSLGRLTETTYPGNIVVSHHYDQNGYEKEMFVNDQPVWTLTGYDGLNTTERLGSATNALERSTTRDEQGLLTGIYLKKKSSSTMLHQMTFLHDAQTGNLTKRTGMLQGEDELFTYDQLDRLVRYQDSGGHWDKVIQYTQDGNIQYKTGLGMLDYKPTVGIRPHAVKGAENTGGLISTDDQTITYNDWGKASSIQLNHAGKQYDIAYGPDGERWTSALRVGGGSPVSQTMYMGDMEVTDGTTFIQLPHGILLRKTGTQPQVYYQFTDHLGSITRIYDSSGTAVFSASYDPWGEQSVTLNTIHYSRGYCGHEMLTDFQLINMNGRLYDPLLGRFLSPDNYVQLPTSAQSFNRYSYCLNNPLKYVDPDGEFWWIIGAAAVGGILNLASNSDNIHSFGDFVKYFGVGAAAGALGGYVGGGVAGAIGIGGAIGGAVSGFAGGVVSGGILGGGNALLGGTNFWQGFGYGALYGGIIGGIGGGIIGGVTSALQGNNPWTGAAKPSMIKPEVKWDPSVIPESMKQTQTFGPQWQELPETPLPEWAQTPWQKGQAGVNRAISEYTGDFLQKEVTLEVNGTRIRMDFVGRDPDGVLHFFEIKNGPYARFTPNQKVAIPQLENSIKILHSQRTIQIIPRGNNAMNIDEFRSLVPTGKPFTGSFRVDVIHYW